MLWFNNGSAVPWITSRELFRRDDNTNGLLGLTQATLLSTLDQFPNGSKWVCFEKLLARVYVHSHAAPHRHNQFWILFCFSLFTFHLFETFEVDWSTGDFAKWSVLGLVGEWSKCSLPISSVLWSLNCVVYWWNRVHNLNCNFCCPLAWW